MNYFIDTSGWLEYIRGSSAGEKVRDFIESDQVFTSSFVIAEVVSKSIRDGEDSNLAFNIVSKNSLLISLDEKEAFLAGEIHAKTRKKIGSFSLADAFMVVSAKKVGAILATTDNHFKSFKNVLMLK